MTTEEYSISRFFEIMGRPTMVFNKSLLFHLAHKIEKENGLSFGNALKEAWITIKSDYSSIVYC